MCSSSLVLVFLIIHFLIVFFFIFSVFFLSAEATPKSLMKAMEIPGLTLYHLKSHLQVIMFSRIFDSMISVFSFRFFCVFSSGRSNLNDFILNFLQKYRLGKSLKFDDNRLEGLSFFIITLILFYENI